MEKQTFIEELEALTNHEDLIGVGKELNELRTKFEGYILEETHKFQVAQLKARDRGETIEDNGEITSLKETFYPIFNQIKEKRKAEIIAKKEKEAENLKLKKALISQFKEVIEKEENIGAAFTAHKEINEKWKSIGDIPRDKRQEIQHEYSRLLEEFFYNMKIYKEIKEYDFKKNQKAKEDVVQKLNALTEEKSIKEIESQLKTLQNEWEDIGPTIQEEWEKLKEDYWSVVKTLYDKIRSHYDGIREQKKENIKLKKELIENVKALLSNERTTVKDWNKQTKALIKIQKEWKTIGFGTKKENETVWKEFRALCNTFFEEKSTFFESIQEEFDEIAHKKMTLIEVAEQLKDETDWKDTAAKIIQLQKKWKDLGSAGQKHEQRLWTKFRAACDHFFNAKKAFYRQLDKEKENNLSLKEALIKEIETLQLSDDTKASLTKLKNITTKYNDIGPVPLKNKDEVYRAYKKALDEHYKNLNIEGKEKEKILFEAKLATLRGSSNSEKLLDKEKQIIRKQIDEIKQNIIQYENNLGFFSNSKGANALKSEVEQNIEAERKKIETLKSKLKLIPNE